MPMKFMCIYDNIITLYKFNEANSTYLVQSSEEQFCALRCALTLGLSLLSFTYRFTELDVTVT